MLFIYNYKGVFRMNYENIVNYKDWTNEDLEKAIKFHENVLKTQNLDEREIRWEKLTISKLDIELRTRNNDLSDWEKLFI